MVALFCYIITFDAAVKTNIVLAVDNLKLADSKKIFFQNISFELSQGETLAIMGPSGIGKSMLAKAIAGFLPANIKLNGNIYLNGTNVAPLSLIERRDVQRPSIIFQDALKALNPLVNIEKHLSLALTGNKTKLNADDKAILYTLIERLGLAKDLLALYPSQLSGGQRQRVCIAIALLGNTNILIADEPTSALDPITEAAILKLLFSSTKQKNKTSILITHDLNAALACDKLLVIDQGEMVAFGAPLTALYQSESHFCKALKKCIASHEAKEKYCA